MSNPAITAAIIAASAEQQARDTLLQQFRDARALGASSAIAFTAASKEEQAYLDYAIKKGSIVRGRDGRLHLDERAIADRKEGAGFVLLLVLLVVVSILASGAALLLLAS